MSVLDEASLLEVACDTQHMSALLCNGQSLQPNIRGARIHHASVLRHKQGKRCLIKYLATDTSGSAIEFLGKIRFKGLDRKSAAIQQRLAALHRDGAEQCRHAPVAVPRVYGTLPSLNMWLQEFVCPATPLTVDSDNFIAAQPSVAQALAQLHQTRLLELAHHTIDEELTFLRTRFQRLRQTHPELDSHINRLEEKVDAVANELRSSSLLTTIHRDFYFDQVLLTETQVVMVDLDLCCLGPLELDVGNYIGHLREYAIRFPESADRCDHAENIFVNAYLRHMPQAGYEPIQHWATLTLARHVSLSTVLPGRSPTTLALIENTMNT
ncbi:MAG: aminoglycoside phosphotransferase family protein [Pirellulaceae bacterium]